MMMKSSVGGGGASSNCVLLLLLLQTTSSSSSYLTSSSLRLRQQLPRLIPSSSYSSSSLLPPYTRLPPLISRRFFYVAASSSNNNTPQQQQQRMNATPTDDYYVNNNNSEDQLDHNVFHLIQSHQENAARLPPVEEIRTILHHTLRGVLSTFSMKHHGYPSASMVDFASDSHGSPLLAVSNLAVHSKDLSANPKCSLLVSKDPNDRTDLVIILHGDAIPVNQSDRETIRSAYLATHPDAFWVDFGDFQFLRIEPKVVRYVSGVATALLGSGEFSKDEFAAAKVDPIYQFAQPITSHMNKDHADDTKLIVQHSTSVPVEYAYMLDMDSLGFNVKAGYQGNTFKLRIPFPRRAADRKDVKTLIVEMLQAARSTQGS